MKRLSSIKSGMIKNGVKLIHSVANGEEFNRKAFIQLIAGIQLEYFIGEGEDPLDMANEVQEAMEYLIFTANMEEYGYVATEDSYKDYKNIRELVIFTLPTVDDCDVKTPPSEWMSFGEKCVEYRDLIIKYFLDVNDAEWEDWAEYVHNFMFILNQDIDCSYTLVEPVKVDVFFKRCLDILLNKMDCYPITGSKEDTDDLTGIEREERIRKNRFSEFLRKSFVSPS